MLSSLLLSAAAMLSKEHGVTAVGVCFAADAAGCFGGASGASGACASKLAQRKLRSLTALALGAAALLALRARAMGFSAPTFARADNPAAASDCLLSRALTFAHLPALNLWLLLCPSTLSFDWSMDAVPVVGGLWDRRNLASAAFYALLASLALSCLRRTGKATGWPTGVTLRRREEEEEDRRLLSPPATALSLLLLAVPFLPATNLLFYVGFVVAERVLYVPSLGFCLLVSHAVDRVATVAFPRGRRRRRRRGSRWAFWLAATFLLLLPAGLRTLRRNHDWGDEGRLYLSGAAVNPPKGELRAVQGCQTQYRHLKAL